MTPPKVLGSAAAADSNQCDINQFPEIDLTPFKAFPSADTLPAANQKDQEVKTFYHLVDTAFKIDEQFGDKNGKLKGNEVEAYLKANPEEKQFFDACSFMGRFRFFAPNLPSLKTKFENNPEVDVALFRTLPFFDQFPELTMDDLENPKVLEGKINEAMLPEEFKKALLGNQELLTQYFLSKSYIKADSDGNGKFTIEEARQGLVEMGDTASDPADYLLQAKMAAAVTGNMGNMLRTQIGLGSDSQSINMQTLVALLGTCPELIRNNENLSAFVSAFFPKDAQGEISPSLESEDYLITWNEFKDSPSIQFYLQVSGKKAEDVFKSMQDLDMVFGMPVSFWPDDLKASFEKMDKEPRDAIEANLNLPIELQQIDWAIRMMEAESTSKFDQEKLNHTGTGRLFINTVTFGWWNNYWQNKRPEEHKASRDQAISTFKDAVKDQLEKGADFSEVLTQAISSLISSGKGDVVKILQEDCDYDKWVSISKTLQNVERNKQILQVAEEFRSGKHDSFWEAQIFPCPELGRGGWFDRASEGKNWTIFNNPQTIMALTLNNYLAYETPNNFDFKNHSDFSLLMAQLPKDRIMALQAIFENIKEGKEVKSGDIEPIIKVPQLSAEGQAELITQIKIELVKAQNVKALQEEAYVTEYKKLPEDKQKEAEELANIILSQFMDPENPLDPEKIKKVIEASDSTMSKVVSAVAEVDMSREKQLVEAIKSKDFPDTFTRALTQVIMHFKRAENFKAPASAKDALFREAQFSDPDRARQLFNLSNPTEAEQKEFAKMVDASNLSNDTLNEEGKLIAHGNKFALKVAFLKQPSSAIAEAAEANYLAILGEPIKDPATGEWSSRYTGNLHSAMRTTLNKSLFGLGAYGAPTLVAGSAGHAVFKSFRGLSALPAEEITGWTRVLGGRVINRIGNVPLLRTITGEWNPWVGAVITGAAGTAFTVSRYGDDLRAFAYDGITYPYLPWSDAAMMDMPVEGVNFYLDIGASLQGMDAILGTAKTIGTLEPGTRLANAFGRLEMGARIAKRIEPVFPEVANFMRARLGINTLALGGMTSAVKAAGAAFSGKTEIQIAEEVLKGAQTTAPWAADVPGMATAERVWAKQAFEKAQRELATVRGHFTSTPEAQRFVAIQDRLASSGVAAAERAALSAEMKTLIPSIPRNALRRLTEAEVKVRSLEALGRVGQFPQFSSSILKRAQKWIEEGTRAGNPELIERGYHLLQKGAVQYMQLPLMGMQNQRMAKFMLWTIFHESFDDSTRPKTPIVFDHPEGIASGSFIPPVAAPAAKPAGDKQPRQAK